MDTELKKAFRYLELYLKATVHRIVKLKVDEEAYGGEQEYLLISFRLSFPDRQLVLHVQEPESPELIRQIRYDSIINLAFNDNGIMLKTWVYTNDQECRRFYLRYNPHRVAGRAW